MKGTVLNHYTDFSVIRNEQFLEKEKLVIWLDDLIRKKELESSASEKLKKKKKSQANDKLTKNQVEGYKFEKEMWQWLLKLKPQIINHPGYDLKLDLSSFKIAEEIYKPFQNKKQTDVLATFNDHIFVVECKATLENANFSRLNKEIRLMKDLIDYKNKRITKLFGLRAIPVHILALKGFKISDEEKAFHLSDPEGPIIILTEKEREYIDVVLDNSGCPEFALNQFLGFFRNGKPDFNKWELDKKNKFRRKKFKIAAFSSNSGIGKKKNVYTFSIEPRDMLNISTVAHQKAKNIFEFERSSSKYYQRLLTGKRLKEIGQHLEKNETPFPNNILVSYRGKKNLIFEEDAIDDSQNTGRRAGKLIFDGCPGTFHVIDGQHRLFGYMSVDDKAGGLKDSHRIIVTVFDGLSVSQEADIFIEVNEKSQSVASDLMMEIDYATGSESKSNLCNGIIFNLRDNKDSVLFDKIAPAEETRKKGLQPWDIKPTDLKNSLMKFNSIGSIEKYVNGVFYKNNYNESASNLFEHLNSLLKIVEDNCGYWHNNISPKRGLGKDWYNQDMKRSQKGFLQNTIVKGLFRLFDRITVYCYRKDTNQSIEQLTEKCKKIVEEICEGFNKLSSKEKFLYFDVRNKYGQAEPAIDKVVSLFLVKFLDIEKYEDGLITESDKSNVADTSYSLDYEILMAENDALKEKLVSQIDPGERAKLLEKDFRRKINSVFERLFGKNYWNEVFFEETDTEKFVIEAKRLRQEAYNEYEHDPERDVAVHDYDIEYLQWVDWIEIIKIISNKKDYYEKKHLTLGLQDDLDTIIRKLFYIDTIKPIKQCNWKEGTEWMSKYNVIRRTISHPGSARLTSSVKNYLEDIEPKVEQLLKNIIIFTSS
jgi:DGQHR domain-containing protein